MNMRTAAAAALLTAGIIGFTPMVAGAAGESVGGCVLELVHAAEEEGLEEAALAERLDGSIDECQASPNPILPATDEIIWGGAAFLVLLVAMYKWGIPALKKAMEARTEKIRSDLAAAEGARRSAEEAQAAVEAQLRDARAEAARIIDAARGQADVVRADLQQRAESDIAELRARADSEVQTARAAAQDDVRREVAALAIGAAEVVVGSQLENRLTQIQLIEDYINQVGTPR
ncbi:MAG: F0F1 ATP synthase subunit B [Acidimicrobiales bacterium]